MLFHPPTRHQLQPKLRGEAKHLATRKLIKRSKRFDSELSLQREKEKEDKKNSNEGNTLHNSTTSGQESNVEEGHISEDDHFDENVNVWAEMMANNSQTPKDLKMGKRYRGEDDKLQHNRTQEATHFS